MFSAAHGGCCPGTLPGLNMLPGFVATGQSISSFQTGLSLGIQISMGSW